MACETGVIPDTSCVAGNEGYCYSGTGCLLLAWMWSGTHGMLPWKQMCLDPAYVVNDNSK